MIFKNSKEWEKTWTLKFKLILSYKQNYSNGLTLYQEEEQDSRPVLSEFLERLCLVLYDSLRPLIIQV